MGIYPTPLLFCITMKKIILSILLLHSFLYTVAQALIYDENFNDNRNKWIEASNESLSALIADGSYKIEYKLGRKSWNFWNKVNYFSNNKDFSIESKFRLTDGLDDGSFSLIFGVRDAFNQHGIALNGRGAYKIDSWIDSQYVSIKPWTKHPAVKLKGFDNTLRIDAKGSSVFYYINDSLVHRGFKPVFLGPNIGFNLEKQIKVSVDYLKLRQDLKLNLVADAVQDRVKENLGTGINSPANDIMPVISADGKTIYSVRKKYVKNIGKDLKDDVWVSTLGDDGKWKEALNLGAPINNDDHNLVVYSSPDGQTLIVGNKYRADGSISGKGISISRKKGNSWSVPEPIEVENYINNEKQVAISFSSNRKVMLLSVAGKNCYGYKDIYVSFQIDDNHYSEPMNLGTTINTYMDETTPFLAADGKTLYFSSEGHVGYGSADIFVSRRLDESWTKWSEPQNLGPEINTDRWDAYYNIPASGEKAYMVTSDQKLTNTEIISIEIPKDARPEPVNILSGKVFHAISKTPMQAEVSFHNSPNHNEAGLSNSDAISGSYKIVLPLGKIYESQALKKGFYAGSQVIDLRKSKIYTEQNLDIYLYPLEKGITIPIERMSFDNKAQATDEAKFEADRLINLLEQYPDMKIQLQLSNKSVDQAKKQADNLKSIMTGAGIKADRLSVSTKTAKESFAFQIISIYNQDITAVLPKEFNSKIDIKTIKAGNSFRIDNLYFLADSSSFTPNSIRSLDELAAFLQKNPKIQVEIGGHTNGLPAHAYCDRLSAERAQLVAKYLISKGVGMQQISSKGYGKRAPLSDNSTELGRRLNQRVEVKVLKVD